MICSNRCRLQRQTLLSFGAMLALACGLSPDEGVTDAGGECTASPAVVLSITGETEAISECIISLVEQDPTDDRRWTIATECGQDGFSVEIVLDPPLEGMPLEVGEQVSSFHLDEGADGHYVEILVDNQLRIAMVDIRLPEAESSAAEAPLFPPGLFEFEWSVVLHCIADDPQCGPVERRQVAASMGSSLDPSSPEPQVSILGPEQPHGVIFDASHRYGVWLGSNWVSDCAGEATAHVSYVIAALPLP